jgi:hypothetical protein
MDVPAPTYEMYYDGLSYTCGYNVLSCPLIVDGIDFTPTYNQFFNDITLQDNDLILNFDYAQLEGIVMYGGLIISLTADELVLKPRYSSSYYYFKRTNENVLPRNDVNLDGVFVFDNYKEVESDVLTLDQNINDGSSCTFTSDLSLLDKEIHYKGLFSPPLPGTISDITFPHIGWIENDNTFAFEVSETHLNIFSLSYEVYPYKIVQYNDFELVLRYHMNCNTYKEYHLTKVN